MADSKWDRVNQLTTRSKETSLTPPGTSQTPVASIDTQLQKSREQRIGLIGEFQKKKIERTTVLSKIKAIHNAEMQVLTHSLQSAVSVEKMRIDTVVNRYVEYLTAEFINDMQELGLRNAESRTKALREANRLIAPMLQELLAEDLPDFMRDATIKNVTKIWEDYTSKVMQEEFKPPK